MLKIPRHGSYEINDKYAKKDFVQGKFYRPVEKLEIPICLDKEIKEFFGKTASRKNSGLAKIVNTILRKEMEMLKAMGI